MFSRITLLYHPGTPKGRNPHSPLTAQRHKAGGSWKCSISANAAFPGTQPVAWQPQPGGSSGDALLEPSLSPAIPAMWAQPRKPAGSRAAKQKKSIFCNLEKMFQVYLPGVIHKPLAYVFPSKKKNLSKYKIQEDPRLQD